MPTRTVLRAIKNMMSNWGRAKSVYFVTVVPSLLNLGMLSIQPKSKHKGKNASKWQVRTIIVYTIQVLIACNWNQSNVISWVLGSICINTEYETHLWVLALSSCGLWKQLPTAGLPANYPSRLSHHSLQNKKEQNVKGKYWEKLKRSFLSVLTLVRLSLLRGACAINR